MRILGIDPGYERMGIAVLDKKNGKECLLHSECFVTDRSLPFYERLRRIGNRVKEAIAEHEPAALAIENLFVANNQKTAMKVGEARGAILYEAACAGLSIHEYTPLQVKIAVTGYGASDKRQVEGMVRRILSMPEGRKIDDEMDAIAIALTGLASIR